MTDKRVIELLNEAMPEWSQKLDDKQRKRAIERIKQLLKLKYTY